MVESTCGNLQSFVYTKDCKFDTCKENWNVTCETFQF